MNRLYVVLTVVAFVALPVGVVRADGLIVQLPKDGAWATFDMHQVKSLVDRYTGGTLIEDSSSDCSLRVSSVGQAVVEGKPCRWVEFKILETLDGKMQSIIFKALIPEEHLKRGGDPEVHIVRGWAKAYDKPIVPIKDVDKGPLGLLLSGPLQDSKKLDSKVIDCKAGKLNCDGLSGTTAWKDQAGRKFQTTHEIRLHDKSPFGVAFWDSRTEMDDQVAARMTIKMTSTFSESGTNAKSELPDHN